MVQLLRKYSSVLASEELTEADTSMDLQLIKDIDITYRLRGLSKARRQPVCDC
jgi:hypothetical protein